MSKVPSNKISRTNTNKKINAKKLARKRDVDDIEEEELLQFAKKKRRKKRPYDPLYWEAKTRP